MRTLANQAAEMVNSIQANVQAMNAAVNVQHGQHVHVNLQHGQHGQHVHANLQPGQLCTPTRDQRQAPANTPEPVGPPFSWAEEAGCAGDLDMAFEDAEDLEEATDEQVAAALSCAAFATRKLAVKAAAMKPFKAAKSKKVQVVKSIDIDDLDILSEASATAHNAVNVSEVAGPPADPQCG